ncbi:ADP-ribose pyrophosphatase YjhB (NUDIX family) [Novosphingobium kunmingense]|uniref:ADP-ribose pyrophosphatase YjhB (NUDIX family) n=1 Tax=Novosphingobium kunmingense TaxID=1211806 RepID=A0A2N0H772_9SPHN|nr:NUDIX domain-containing protein [Novosphingobium kunmingense]PKB14774.1 ADP-ribose pyrophosphatase YjhB (NUDIX family) [Novosphingobium kunmingense]
MLRLIPAPLHRGGLIVAHRLRLVWWRIVRPTLNGCRVIAFDLDGRVLLVRHSYGSGRWMLPGGGFGRHEDVIAAARRELKEEVHCDLAHPVVVAVVEEPLSGAINRVHLIAGRTQGVPRADGREIIAAAYFSPDDLPVALATSVAAGLPQWVTAAEAALSRPPVDR